MISFITAHMNIIAQAVGFCAMITSFLTYQFNKRKSIMTGLVICASLWSLHFMLLGKYTAVAMNLINVIRNLIYGYRESKPWANKNAIPYIFIVISGIMTVVTWENLWSIVPFIAAIFGIMSGWQTEPKKIKILTIPVNIGWFAYNFVSKSYAGMINETITFISIIISLIKYKNEHKLSVKQ